MDSNDTPATLNVQQSSSSSPRSIITKKPISTIDEYLRKFTEVVIAKNDDRLQLELKELYESAADKQFWLEALAKDDFYCFANASETGRLDVLTRLYEMCPESKREIMLASGSYRAFILASRTNRVEVIKTLWKWCGNKENRVKMLKSNDYECFWAGKGKIDLI